MHRYTVRLYDVLQVARDKWIGVDRNLGTQVDAPTLPALIGLLVPDGLGVNVNVKIRPMGLSAPVSASVSAPMSEVQEVQEVQLTAAAHGYIDSKRLDKLDEWLHGDPERDILVASRVDRAQRSFRSIGAWSHKDHMLNRIGPNASTLRELIDKL